MDISNKTINVKALSSNHETQETKVSFDLMERIEDGFYAKVGEYDLNLSGAYSGPNDGQLLLLIQEKLSAI